MKQPIKAGDLAEVIGGLQGRDSPNLGLIVKVLAYQGDHTQYGPIWICQAEHAVIGQPGTRDMAPGYAHFAQDWLRKIEPPSQSTNTETNVSKEITA